MLWVPVLLLVIFMNFSCIFIIDGFLKARQHANDEKLRYTDYDDVNVQHDDETKYGW